MEICAMPLTHIKAFLTKQSFGMKNLLKKRDISATLKVIEAIKEL
jgi:hypothetical protein